MKGGKVAIGKIKGLKKKKKKKEKKRKKLLEQREARYNWGLLKSVT